MTGGFASRQITSLHDPVTPGEFADLMSAVPVGEGAPLAVAVSGGADSMALLWLLKGWTSAKGMELFALTVDHGLRPESEDEAGQVGRWCATMGIPHEVLVWAGDKPTHRIQEAARHARYTLMEDWCARHGIGDLFVAHTQNDQAETFLFRMSRGSGPDGLASMPLMTQRDRIRVVRPLLTAGRARLEATLLSAGQDWVDDPGNADRRYARVRIRCELAKLDAHGVSVAAVAGTARIFGQMRHKRETNVSVLAEKIVTLHPEGYAVIDRNKLTAADPEIAAGLISALTMLIGGREFAPKRARRDRLIRALIDRDQTFTRTLGSCTVSAVSERIRMWREYGTIVDEIPLNGTSWVSWDGRFLMDLRQSTTPATAVVSALGRAGWEAIAGEVCTDFRRIPGPVRYGLPAIRQGNDILQVWHLGYRSAQIVENIVENAVFRPRTPILGPPFWVA